MTVWLMALTAGLTSLVWSAARGSTHGSTKPPATPSQFGPRFGTPGEGVYNVRPGQAVRIPGVNWTCTTTIYQPKSVVCFRGDFTLSPSEPLPYIYINPTEVSIDAPVPAKLSPFSSPAHHFYTYDFAFPVLRPRPRLAIAPCQFVTPRDARAVTGVTMGPPVSERFSTSGRCEYSSGGVTLTVTLLSTPKSDFIAEVKASRWLRVKVVHGLGAPAYYVEVAGVLLLWRHGVEAKVIISNVNTKAVWQPAMEKALAKRSLSRL